MTNVWRWLVVGCAVVAGCKSVDDDFPVHSGGPGIISDNNPPVDAPITPTDNFTGITGRVCLVTDPRQLDVCATSGAGSLTVTIGGATAVTLGDGTFAIARPSGSNLLWHVTGATIVTSVMAFGPDNQIPALLATRYLDLENSNGVLQITGQGAVIAAVQQANAPAIGATATVAPPAAFGSLYDGATALDWNQTATGPFGVMWLPGITAGQALVTVAPATGTSVNATFVVEDGAITFDTVVLP